jgi:exonuclease VII large subunit
LVPDKKAVTAMLTASKKSLATNLQAVVAQCKNRLERSAEELEEEMARFLELMRRDSHTKRQMLELLSPQSILARGYTIIRTKSGGVVRSATIASKERSLQIEFNDGKINVETKES